MSSPWTTAHDVEAVPVLAEDLAGFTLATVMLIVVVLALGWAEDVVARRRARLSPWPAEPIAPPFVASTESPDPTPRRPAEV
jgi:hypothetical protein